jgi:hypothetical protein
MDASTFGVFTKGLSFRMDPSCRLLPGLRGAQDAEENREGQLETTGQLHCTSKRRSASRRVG